MSEIYYLGDRPREVVTQISGDRHLLFLLMEARIAFEEGDYQRGLTNLLHSVFCAATDGRGRLSETELIHELRKIGGFGFDPDGAA